MFLGTLRGADGQHSTSSNFPQQSNIVVLQIFVIVFFSIACTTGRSRVSIPQVQLRMPSDGTMIRASVLFFSGTVVCSISPKTPRAHFSRMLMHFALFASCWRLSGADERPPRTPPSQQRRVCGPNLSLTLRMVGMVGCPQQPELL